VRGAWSVVMRASEWRIAGDGGGAGRIESDREALPFPDGGVWGAVGGEGGGGCAEVSHDELVSGVHETLEHMQARLDELSAEVERTFRLPGFWPDGDPPAAA